MNKKAILLAFIFLLLPSLSIAEEITVTVKGMVCSFCAQGIKKTFSKFPEVESVTPDLDKNLVTIVTKEGFNLSDEKVTELITDAGFEVAQIERHK
jgi:copper chaperone CopZ